MKQCSLLIALFITLTACTEIASESNTQPTPNTPTVSQNFEALEAKTPNAPLAAIDEQLISRVGALPPQQLSDGSCGLFLWASLPERTLVFHAISNSDSGVMMLDKNVTSLNRTSGSGQSFAGFFTEQSLVSGNTKIKLQFIPEQEKGFTDGAIIRRGSIRMADETGWEVVMPVAGLIGCR